MARHRSHSIAFKRQGAQELEKIVSKRHLAIPIHLSDEIVEALRGVFVRRR